jgi:glycosyltransferase involved in cell wall biosynthesis
MTALAAQSPTSASCADSGRVVIATVARPSGDTGVHTHSRTLREGLIAAGFDCQLATPFDGSRKWLPIFAARRAILDPFNRTWGTRWYRHWHMAALRENLLRSLQARAADGVIAQCPLSAHAALDVRQQLGHQFPIAMVCHFNYSEATEYRDKGELSDRRAFEKLLAFEKDVMESVDQVIYVSAWARRVVEQDRGIRPRSAKVSCNGLSRDVPPPQLTRNDLGLSAEDLVLINVGTLEPRKNQFALLDLFKAIVGEFPQARLLLIGEGPARPDIQVRIDALELHSHVRLLGFRMNVPDLLAMADLYVHAAMLENCPMSLLEAARAALPVAAAPGGGVPELLGAIGGLAIDLQSPAAALATLRPLLANASARTRAGQVARQAFECQFTGEVMVRNYIRALGLAEQVGGRPRQ